MIFKSVRDSRTATAAACSFSIRARLPPPLSSRQAPHSHPAPRGSPALDQLLVMRLPDGLRLLGRCQPGGDVGGNSIQFRVCGEHLAHAPVELVLVGRQGVEP
jgi:hypothetical protein